MINTNFIARAAKSIWQEVQDLVEESNWLDSIGLMIHTTRIRIQ